MAIRLGSDGHTKGVVVLQSCCQGRNSDCGVEVMWGCDEHGVDEVCFQQLIWIFEHAIALKVKNEMKQREEMGEMSKSH